VGVRPFRRTPVAVSTAAFLTFAPVAGALVATVPLAPSSTSASTAAPDVSPAGMRGLDGATRVIVVSAWNWRTTYATARDFQWSKAHGWHQLTGPMAARVGYNGMILPTQRHEGDGTTPVGVYGFVFDFGSRSNPGVSGFQYRPLRPGDCWAGTRVDYNRWVVRNPCAPQDENLWSSEAVAYRYASVIDFNYWQPVYGRGSGIFLHEQTGSPTAGCVSLGQGDLLWTLRWMRPGTRIVIGPYSYLESLK
jgi:L,D-peptidoglycan transpeptidase YkuD (ErfK/YbiS/YcfS/YnhG family)